MYVYIHIYIYICTCIYIYVSIPCCPPWNITVFTITMQPNGPSNSKKFDRISPRTQKHMVRLNVQINSAGAPGAPPWMPTALNFPLPGLLLRRKTTVLCRKQSSGPPNTIYCSSNHVSLVSTPVIRQSSELDRPQL